MMPDDRRCPRCGSEGWVNCESVACQLPMNIWDDWEQLKRERDEAKAEAVRQGDVMGGIGCQYCKKGEVPELLDRDGVNCKVSGNPGVWCHSAGDHYWLCPRIAVAQVATVHELVVQLMRERDEARVEIAHLRTLVEEIRGRYTEVVFTPDGTSQDAASARFARGICNEILATEAEEK